MKKLNIASAVTALVLSANVNAAFITFNGTTAGSTRASNTTYTEAGYSLEIGSGSAYFIDADSGFPGMIPFDDDALEFNYSNASFTMIKDGGGLFDFLSVETGSLGRSTNDDGNFIFTGIFGEGGTISSTILAVSGPTVTLNTFSGFTGLSKLIVRTTDGQFPVLDNLEISAVPVPTAAWLFGSGLIGLIGFARRKKA